MKDSTQRTLITILNVVLLVVNLLIKELGGDSLPAIAAILTMPFFV